MVCILASNCDLVDTAPIRVVLFEYSAYHSEDVEVLRALSELSEATEELRDLKLM